MKRTTLFMPDDLSQQLEETAARVGRSQSDLVREALSAFLSTMGQPWPASFGAFESGDDEVGSSTAKRWVRDQWREAAAGGAVKPAKPHRPEPGGTTGGGSGTAAC